MKWLAISPDTHQSSVITIGVKVFVILLFLNVISASGQVSSVKKAKSPWHEHPELFSAPEVTWVDSVGPDYSLFYEGGIWQGKKTKVFAYYSVPEKTSTKIPAMVLVHGGGGKAYQNWAKQWAGYGYAAISMNLYGKDNEGNQVGYLRHIDTDADFNVEETKLFDSWYYQAVAAIIRAVSFLESRSEVNKEKIGIMGISWGGYNTSVTVGVDERLSAAIIVYGCGELYKNSVWTREGHVFSETYKQQLDPANYLPNAKIPIFWLNNNTDHFFPLDSFQSSRKLTKGKNYARIQDNYSHGYETPWKTEDIRRFADAFLLNGDPWPEIRSSGIKKSMICAKVDQKIEKAWMVYTLETDWMHKSVRKEGHEIWVQKEVTTDKSGKAVQSEIPENAVAVYLHMKDSKEREFSTDYFIPKDRK
ncbi:MAG: hypothetical protein A2W90_03705 [Bacteroidetes bacterium GWF2_42_66]|nr:MAG: hypothetical protein A2W92_18625 [Bacteroidetes bacterium GWA2_42_15]OFY02566.1 MAG: hypothetical protein A2W89_22145 [Bacteroidetes bacterium GWE2_42_39]OFY41334.1 MAG: hypothetical protein A2W90_03705 [Bacteroidetes bacterium GWF2_42_66]